MTNNLMLESILFVILIFSFGGSLFILARKIPVINSLPQNAGTGIRKHKIILEIENRIKWVSNFFEKQIFLHKILSWIKVITLRIETNVDHSLHKIRRKAQGVGKDVNSKK